MVEVRGMQLSELDDTALAVLRSNFNEHGLLLFREQNLDPAQHQQFAERFGTIVLNNVFQVST